MVVHERTWVSDPTRIMPIVLTRTYSQRSVDLICFFSRWLLASNGDVEKGQCLFAEVVDETADPSNSHTTMWTKAKVCSVREW